ncbi:MAG: hypothetical protein E7294_04135 [Lachnospiraceae bacterium]|nr:hypothetical protein [Lachnospiraceae bacterium]
MIPNYWNQTETYEALAEYIRMKNYPQKLELYKGNLLLIGINYEKDAHSTSGSISITAVRSRGHDKLYHRYKTQSYKVCIFGRNSFDAGFFTGNFIKKRSARVHTGCGNFASETYSCA